ncbi:MAG: Rieske 2Fe-2S domain-containing protein [Gammaproteobacteria bacterium]|nr:Rieske 2Fe-2S domain-containing protein [Gammaproteobacteria bacterium]
MNLTDQTAVILQQVNRPIEQARGLPNDCYVSDDAFILDRDQVIAPGWACIGFADELPENNFAAPIDFMGLPLLLTRDSDETIRVFHNVCSHRGMQLADEPCKNNGSVRCPYHAWTYALDGTLRGTPNIGGYGQHTHPDFNNEEHGLREVRSEIWLGAIFVNLSGTAESFIDYTAPIRESWSRLVPAESLDQLTYSPDSSRMSLTVQSNWKLAVENYLESYHLPTVHPELNRISPLPAHYCVEPFRNGAGQGSTNYTRLEIDNQTLPELQSWESEHARIGE